MLLNIYLFSFYVFKYLDVDSSPKKLEINAALSIQIFSLKDYLVEIH